MTRLRRRADGGNDCPEWSPHNRKSRQDPEAPQHDVGVTEHEPASPSLPPRPPPDCLSVSGTCQNLQDPSDYWAEPTPGYRSQQAIDMLFVCCGAYGWRSGWVARLRHSRPSRCHLLPSQYHLPSLKLAFGRSGLLTPGASISLRALQHNDRDRPLRRVLVVAKARPNPVRCSTGGRALGRS